MSSNISIDLRRKNGDLTDSIAEADRARHEQFAATQKASSARRKARELEDENSDLKAELEAKEALIREKDLAILEWMHSNSAFKRVAKKYAKELNLTTDEQSINLDNAILDIAEEDPNLAQTNVVNHVKSKLKM